MTPIEADRILREFYGLPKPDTAAPPPAANPPERKIVDLLDFL